ncbi:paraplegin [Anoplophora glabripennis]|uniref:paraplegin n=1 Tax=Anoplophora glabripennis TaxID=217634 RepID=UPI0008747D91|nr:paraplegin [Anoplophora glabripennis]
MYRHLKSLHFPLRSVIGDTVKQHKHFFPNVGIQNKLFSTFQPHPFSKLGSTKLSKSVNQEYAAVHALLYRSGLQSITQLQNYLNKRNIHTTPSHFQNPPKQNGPGGQKPDKDDEDKDKISALLAKAFLWMLTAYMVIAVISLMFPSSNQPEVVRYVAWNEFLYQMLAKGEVEEIIVRPDIEIVTLVLYDGAVIKGKRIDNRTFHMNVVDVNKFEDKLREAERRLGIQDGVPVIYERSTDTAGKLLISLLVVAILISMLARSKSIRPPISMDTFTQLGRAKFTLVDPLTGPGKGVHFSDVAGLREAKQEVMEFVDYLKRPEHYKNLGAKVPKGALLLGPPGCGKTLLAKAVATEANVPFLSMNGSEFIEMIGGLGAARVRDLFKEARKRAPCIIYIDEIDAVGRKRSGQLGFEGASGESEQTLNQLLVEMDGMASKENVIMLASTNRADILDKALLRPGRFDRHILIDYPDLIERKEIFEQHLKIIALEHSPETYSKRLAYLTPGFSGADIANVCNESALHAARLKKTKVSKDDLEYAVERLVGGTEKRNHAMSLQEKEVVAYHESGHALVGWMLEHTDALLKVTIVPRTSLALGFAQYIPRDQKLYTKEELFDRMCMTLGGRVAESLIFNRVTTGAQNDLEKVTKMAYAQVKEYGMSNTVGLISFPEEETKELGKRPYSKKLANVIDAEVRSLVASAYKHTEGVLLKHKSKLIQLAETLFKKETLNYEDVEKLLGPPPHGRKKLIDPAEFEENVRKDAGDYKSRESEASSPV